MLKIAVCDDEKKDRENLEGLIKKYFTEINEKYLLKVYESGEQLLADEMLPDILFLDIIMNEKDGLQAGAELKKKSLDIIIIYTTNLNEKMAVALNQIHSFAYLIKPIGEEDLFRIMSDARHHINYKVTVKTDMATFVSEYNTPIDLPVMDIYYFES